MSRTPINLGKAVAFALAKKPLIHCEALTRMRVVERTQGGVGSGFFVSDKGHVVTNAHVVTHDKGEKANIFASCFSETDARKGFDALKAKFPELAGLEKDDLAQLLKVILYAYGHAAAKHGRFEGKRYLAALLPPPTESGGTAPRKYPAQVLQAGKAYPGKDVAVLKVEGKKFSTLQVGDDSSVQVGSQIYVVGFPGHAWNPQRLDSASRLEASITGGIISARKHSPDGWLVFQTDAAISGGNSGGPVFDSKGAVIGIATLTAVDPTSGGRVEGIHYVVPSSVIKEFLDRVRTPGGGHSDSDGETVIKEKDKATSDRPTQDKSQAKDKK
jgi:S1-C subfamily serine protease